IATEDGETGSKALDALDKWATKDSIPTLLVLAESAPEAKTGKRRHHADRTRPERAIKILLKFSDDERTIPGQVLALADVNKRAAAVKALHGFGEKAEPAIAPLLFDKNADLRGLAVLLLAEIGTEKSVPALKQLAGALDAKNRKVVNDAIKLIQ